MGMKPEREAQAVQELNKNGGSSAQKCYWRPKGGMTWKEWEATHDYPTHDGEDGLQNYQQIRSRMSDTFSANLRTLLSGKEESIGPLAGSLGMVPATIYFYLVNKRVPRLHVIEKIARYYKINPVHRILCEHLEE